jgi:hypothetical protein
LSLTGVDNNHHAMWELITPITITADPVNTVNTEQVKKMTAKR